MLKKSPRSILPTILCWGMLWCCLSTGYAQSPWVRSKAGFYIQTTWQSIPRYDALFLQQGGLQPLDRRLRENTFSLYGEYGLTRRTTILFHLPGRFQQAGQFLANTPQPLTAAGRLSGLGNTSLGLRYALRQNGWPLAVSLRVDLPVDNADAATGLRTGYPAFTFLPMLSTGQRSSRFYWFASGGYALRTDDYCPYMDLGAEAGYHFRKLWLIGFSGLVLPTPLGSDPDLSTNNLRTGLYVNEQAYWSLGLKTIVEVHRFWGLTASGANTVWGDQVPLRPTLSLGIYFRWD